MLFIKKNDGKLKYTSEESKLKSLSSLFRRFKSMGSTMRYSFHWRKLKAHHKYLELTLQGSALENESDLIKVRYGTIPPGLSTWIERHNCRLLWWCTFMKWNQDARGTTKSSAWSQKGSDISNVNWKIVVNVPFTFILGMQDGVFASQSCSITHGGWWWIRESSRHRRLS